MEIYYEDKDLEALYYSGAGGWEKCGRYKKLAKDAAFVAAYVSVVDMLSDAADVRELARLSVLHYEKLKHRPESSVRIINSRVERLLFRENDNGIEITLIEINDRHYGNKR